LLCQWDILEARVAPRQGVSSFGRRTIQTCDDGTGPPSPTRSRRATRRNIDETVLPRVLIAIVERRHPTARWSNPRLQDSRCPLHAHRDRSTEASWKCFLCSRSIYRQRCRRSVCCNSQHHLALMVSPCAYRKLKLWCSGDDVRQRWRVI